MSLVRFPLIDDRLAGRANPRCKLCLREAEFSSEASQSTGIVRRDVGLWGRRFEREPRIRLLVVALHERRGGLSSRPANGSTERRARRKLYGEPAPPSCSTQGPLVDAKFARKLIERERLGVSRMLGQAHRDSLD